MRVRILLMGLIALLCAAVSGCDLDAKIGAIVSAQDQAIGLSQGWVRYDSAGDGFSLDVPSGWMKLDLTGGDLKDSIQMLGDANPQLGTYLNSDEFKSQLASLASSPIKLMLYDTAANFAALQFATNLNVVSMDVPGNLTLEQVINANIDEIKSATASAKISQIVRDEIMLGKKRGEKISYTYGMYLPNGAYVDAALLQYLLLDGNTEYVLTFTTTTEQAKLRSITFDAIANTFRLTK